MKIAIIHVEFCRDCPYAEKVPYRKVFFCTQQDDKHVTGHEIDEGCPLQDEECDETK